MEKKEAHLHGLSSEVKAERNQIREGQSQTLGGTKEEKGTTSPECILYSSKKKRL